MGVVAVLAVLGGVVSPAAGAPLSADERSAGLWYADRLKFDELQAMGLSGEGVTIAVIDDAINLDVPELAGADIEVRGQFCREYESGSELPAVSDDPALASHGTNVVSMLVGNGLAGDGGPGTRGIVPRAKILFYATGGVRDAEGLLSCSAYNPVTDEFEKDREFSEGEIHDAAGGKAELPAALAARQALADGADIISVSSGSDVWTGADWNGPAVQALREGVPLVVATQNPGSGVIDLNVVPAALNGSVVVGGVDNEAELIRGTNGLGDSETSPAAPNLGFVGPGYQILTPSADGAWGPGYGYGTSLATPLIAGTIALGLEKYPQATANQVLQAMVRTTGREVMSEPVWTDGFYGYGVVKPVAMLAVDPTQYPDENPLFVMSADDPRCGPDVMQAENGSLGTCRWAAGPSRDDVWSPGEDDEGANAPVQESGAPATLLLIGGGALVLLVAAAIVIPVSVSRSRRRTAAQTQAQNWNGLEGR